MALNAINNNDTPWSFNTDIYSIEETLVNVRNRYIEDENEDTLNLGIFGFLTDTEAKKIQSAIVITGELGNEMFPSRAKLTKNVLAHAIDCNITDINAVPATMNIDIGIKLDDLNTYIDSSDKFCFDHKSPIFIENIEFHFDYDIVLQRALNSSGEYSYSAHYDMSSENRISNITEPYLVQPFQMLIGNDIYVLFQAEVRQYTIEETEDKIISDSIIENKTYTFEYENQLADFDVYVTSNGDTVRLRPYFYGSAVDTDLYCWYEFISDNTVRVTFDSLSYVPGLNADIKIVAFTTLGEAGNFTYNISPDKGGLYIDMSSEKYSYDNITCFLIPVGDSAYGKNRSTKTELQKKIPIMRSTRGNITTDQDLINYFKLGDTDDERIVVSKKVDNQIARVWYAYFLMKDSNKNIIPTNTINIKIDISNAGQSGSPFIIGEDGRYILPAGTIFKIENGEEYAEIIDSADVPEYYSNEYYNSGYYYMSLYNIMIDTDPLYVAYYMTISDKRQNLIFNWVNDNAILQFVSTSCSFKRSLLEDQSEYKIKLSSAQSLANDYHLYEEDPETHAITNKMAIVLVMYKEDVAYRWVTANLDSYDKDNFVGNWSFNLVTDNGFDTYNNIKLLDLPYNHLHVAGSQDTNYGYMEPNTTAKLYFLAELDAEYGRYDLDSIAPGAFNGYTVTNVYEIKDGLNFYTNFTSVMNTKITNVLNSTTQFTIDYVPMGGLHYMNSEEAVVEFTNTLNAKKEYIDNCLKIIDSTTDIDFKFYNTYGESKTYTTGDQLQTGIGHIDITLKFKVSIKSTNDIYTKDDVLKYIKNYIENLNDIGDLHFPNLITELTNEFNDRINYVEYVTFNDFPLNLGVQHISVKNDLTLADIPEFINIRNHYNAAGDLVPWIDLEVLF